MNAAPSVIIVLADGVRADALTRAIDGGELPALARLREEGGLRSIATVFPSVTGPAYTPFLMGRHPGSVGLPGLRWYDRSHTACRWPGYARSYTGPQCRYLDRDLSETASTMFELTASSIGALSVIRRGLPMERQMGSGFTFVARTAVTHFRGNVAGWLDIDRKIGDDFVRRVRDEHPRFAFGAFTGIDKTSHAFGHEAAIVHDAMRIVDDVCSRIREDAERAGRWDAMHLWVVSDHGHSRVLAHEDLAQFVTSLGNRVVAHPWTVRPGAQVAVAVSGNAMAHVYTGLGDRERRFWPALAPRWSDLADAIMARPSIDLMLLPRSENSCEVRSHDRGRAVVSWRDGRYSYRPETGDPLGVGAHECVDETTAFDATFESDYPDAIVQVARLSCCSRSGDIILSASRDWDLRARYEPIPHVSAHGALHREHIVVPLLTSRPVVGTPRRSVDVMAAACGLLGISAPDIEGNSFLEAGAH